MKNLGQILLVSLGQVSELGRVLVLRVVTAQDEFFTASALLDLVQQVKVVFLDALRDLLLEPLVGKLLIEIRYQLPLRISV